MKIIKIIAINVALLVILLAVIEFCLFYSFSKGDSKIKYNLKPIPYKNFLEYSFPREPVGLQYKNRPIILTGCSYIYGLFMEDNHTPYYKLSELTKRPVYIYALPGKGLQHTLYILQNKFYDTSIKDPEYFIYVMMGDHIRRMYSQTMFDDFMGYPLYHINHKTGEIKQTSDIYPIYRKFFTYYFIKNIIYFNWFQYDYKTHEDNAFVYFRAIRKEIERQYPNIKFVILLYDDYNKFGLDFLKLEKEGFIVLQTKELTGVNLQVKDYQVSEKDTHPTEKAWDIVIPALVKKLKMNG